MPSKPETVRDVDQQPRSGFQFGIPAMIPGLLAGGAIMMGAPMVGVPLIGAAVVGGGVVALVAGHVGAVAVAGVIAGAAAAVAGAAVALGAVAAGAGTAFICVACGAAVGAGDPDTKKYSLKKVFMSVLGGSALGAAMTWGATAAANAPQVPEQTPTRQVETRGAGLCRDFKRAEQAVVPTVQDGGRKVYAMTAPEGRTLTF